ncbi:hypothetical protein ACIBXA_32300 [Micromonospora echinaurantiaca]|uniref:hypothetical protein n=1 Tax=Micromonospora echinaurantiaca TaxID=47857 RepID=UPI003797ED73
MSGAEDPRRARELLGALDAYRPARQAFLGALGLPASNRDPFAEFSEQLVHALLGGKLAASRVQQGHDLVLFDGRKVQVRYLANPGNSWVNEHCIRRILGVELYALVLFEAFVVAGALVFPTDELAPICAALGKRHPRQDGELQFTRRNWWAIRDHPERYHRLGMRVWLPPLD